MQPDQQQRIMGYFIEEAKDHLNTIEQGLLNLQNTIEDPEMVNEVFRAAHSVKGGAAMLGLGSIQRVSHRLEDFFKLLKENPVRVDQKLETLFLRAFDSLQELLGQLQGPFGLTEESANTILTEVEPTFEELEQHLAQLASESGGISLPTTTGFGLDTAFTLPMGTQVDESLVNLFRTDVTLQLRDMLRLFRLSEADPATRQQLQESCNSLNDLGERHGLSHWCLLLETARQAIAHPNNSYRILAPVVIKDIKQAQELVLAGRESEITPSGQLQELLPGDVSVETVIQDDLADLLADLQPIGSESELSDQSLDLAEFDFAQPAATSDHALESLELPSTTHELELIDSFAGDPFDAGELETQHGPEVGMAELNTLADLFEGEVPDLGLTWQQEEVIEEGDDLFVPDSPTVHNSDFNNDFSDLLFEEARTEPSEANPNAAVDDLDDLFGDADLLTAGEARNPFDSSQPDASADISALDEIDELLQVAESTTPSSTDRELLDPFADLDQAFSEPDLTNNLAGLEIQPEPLIEENHEENQTDDSALNNLSDLFGGLDDGDLATDEQPQTAHSLELDIPDPWDTISDAEQVTGDGPELGSLSLEDLDLDDLEEMEEFSEHKPTLDSLVEVPSQNNQDIGLPAITEPFVNQDAISDPWGKPETEISDSRPLSDLSLDELDATGDFSLESPAPVEELALEFSDFDSNGQPDETLIEQLTSTDELFRESDQPAQATEDLFGEELVSEDLLSEDLFGETTEATSTSNVDDLFGEATDPFAPVDTLFGEPADPSISADDLLSETNESLLTSDLDDLLGESATQSGLAEDDLLGEAADQPDVAVDDLLGEISEPALAADADPDNLFSESVDQSASVDDLFGETTIEPLPVASEDGWFSESANDSVSMNGLFDEPADVTSDANVDDLLGDLTLEGANELPFDDRALNEVDSAFTFKPSDEITNILEDEDSPDFPTIAEDESSQLSDQELDDLLGGASDEELDNLLGESFNLDGELMGGLDLEVDSIAESASAEDFTSLDDLLGESSGDLPITTPVEADNPITGLDELDQFLVDEPAAAGYEGLDLNPDLEEERLAPTGELELDFEQPSGESELAATEFGALDSLLDESPAADDIFGDLEGLLDDNQISEPESSTDIASSTEAVEEDLAHEQGSVDDFSELETLVEGSALGLAAAGALGLTGSMDNTPSVSSSEFDDLDDLLKDAEEKMGGSPSVSIGRGATPQARRIMRPGRVFSEQTMRVPVKHLDNLSNLVGELVVNRNSLEQDQERLRQSLDNLLYQVQQLSDVGQRMQDLYERSLLESSLLASRQSHHRLNALSSTGRGGAVTEIQEPSDNVEYDPLEMDRFTGFHSLSQEMIELIVRVRESSSDIEFIVDETEQVTRMFRQVTTQLQEGLTRSRMVPFAQTADRLPRAVRDISMKVGKQAELIIEGRETLIDKMILEQLYDPMTHLVNNALTHGIEAPEVRRSQGKPPAGRIAIRAFHQGNQTIISVSDDGSGINVERVKAKAIEKGLITAAEAQNLSRLDIYDILFHPGFSTKDQADDFSGRGVGMDVVRTSLSEIRGVVNIDSTPGKGTTFTIRLPLTLSISKALCCISDRARIAFPMDGVEDMLDLPKERLQVNAEGQPCIAWRDTILPVRPLSDLLTYNRHLSRGNVYGGNQEDDIISIVVLRSAGNFLALQVDQVLGEQEIVIKQLEGPVPKPVGVAGATVLGDGRIMPIADVLELIDLSMGRLRRDAGGALWDQSGGQEGQEVPAVKTEPMVLIVDDSITVRELLSMTFNKVGYRVEQARDGQEAWEKLRSGLPCDIVFCDIEMPRMDGLELLSRIQKDPNLKQLPIAMLTSRGADRHRQMAASLGASGYFTKPYLEEALLDAAQRMLKGERLLSREG
jgi:chemosensory pili system protein ChpA (sensor histidine kinase/response regulator)